MLELTAESIMVSWTSLAEVENSKNAGTAMKFDPAIVWVVNYVAPYPFPRKFVYGSCPERDETGRVCGRSLEFGTRCGHTLPARPAFRFHLRLCDALHVGVAPMTAHIWDTARILLNCSAPDFALRSELQQLRYMHEVTTRCLKVKIWLTTADRHVVVSHLTLLDTFPTSLTLPVPAVPRGIAECPEVSQGSTSGYDGNSVGRSSKKSIIEALADIERELRSRKWDD